MRCLRKGQIYFVKKITVILAKRVPKTDITKIFECLIDEIFVMFGGCLVNKRSAFLWIQTAPLLADLCLCSYEADFIQGLLMKNEKKLARSFNFTIISKPRK